jgi:hypothetical protein
MERVGHQPKSGHHVLFMLDESATLRRLEAIESAVSYISTRSRKLSLYRKYQCRTCQRTQRMMTSNIKVAPCREVLFT